MKNHGLLFFAIALTAALSSGQACDCGLGQDAYEIPDTGPAQTDSGTPVDAFVEQDGGSEAGTPDQGDDDTLDPDCDSDDDGYIDENCGGDDCDDDNRTINVDSVERCSYVDENCDGENNEMLDCSFLASGEATLYKINPFEETITVLTQVNLPDEHGLLDIDISEDGRTIAVTDNGIYAIDSNGNMTSINQITVPERTNGMAIDSSGRFFLTNNPRTSSVEATAHTADSLTGALSLLGNLAPYVSSGDCVTLKDDSLLMTAPDPDAEYDPENPYARTDMLVFVNSATAQTNVIGDTGYAKIFGLSASFDFLFGVTDNGKVLRIDASTGNATMLFEDANLSFWGAANGD